MIPWSRTWRSFWLGMAWALIRLKSITGGSSGLFVYQALETGHWIIPLSLDASTLCLSGYSDAIDDNVWLEAGITNNHLFGFGELPCITSMHVAYYGIVSFSKANRFHSRPANCWNFNFYSNFLRSHVHVLLGHCWWSIGPGQICLQRCRLYHLFIVGWFGSQKSLMIRVCFDQNTHAVLILCITTLRSKTNINTRPKLEMFSSIVESQFRPPYGAMSCCSRICYHKVSLYCLSLRNKKPLK